MSDQSIPEPTGHPADDQTDRTAGADLTGQPRPDGHAAPHGVPPQAQQPLQPGWQAPVQQPTRQPPYGQSPYGQAPYGNAGYDPSGTQQYPYGKPPYGQPPYEPAWSGATSDGPAGSEQPAPGSVPFEQPYFVPTAHQQAWSAAQHYPGQPYWTPPPIAVAKPRSRRLLIGSLTAAAVTALAAGGIAVAVDRPDQGSSQQTALSTPNAQVPFGQGSTGQVPAFPFGSGSNGSDGSSGSGGSSGSSGSTSAQTTGPASTAQQVGVVDITTTLNYGQGKAAGTGIVLSSDGEILTNNHVVEGSTAITVTVVSTGKSYTATVVGTDPSDDVSVLQLKNASGLTTAKLGNSDAVKVGDAVTAVGNAGGKGGTPTAAPGTVTALNQSLTASDANGSNAERLTGMIQINAAIEAGDSGGPLYDAGGSVVGIDTAASSSSGRYSSAAIAGFAIPIAKALSIADQISSGQASSTVHIGYPAFLGVELSPNSQAATIAGVVDGSAAAKAGLQAGDTVTAVDNTAISTASGLSSTLGQHKPGDQVRLRYTDSAGQSHSVTVTLGAGPAD